MKNRYFEDLTLSPFCWRGEDVPVEMFQLRQQESKLTNF